MWVRCAGGLAAVLASVTAYGAAYPFFSPENGSSAVIALEHFETPWSACNGTIGHVYDSGSGEVVLSATYNPANGNCFARTDAPASRAVTIVADMGSCSDDIDFDFAGQQCLDVPTPTQFLNLLATMLAGGMFVGGWLVGWKVVYR